jgi:bacterial/archaeal transporter family protein
MKGKSMNAWFWYAIGAAILYGAHQIFTKMASDRIGDGLGGFVVEGTAALTILAYLGGLYISGQWNQQSSGLGILYSMLTGICVGIGTVFFFLLFQKGGPLSAVPIMALAGLVFFKETATWQRLLGIVLAIAGLFLLRV